MQTEIFNESIAIAKSHQQWPWEWSGKWQENARLRSIAAVVAVADLLDEDSARCDTTTLLEHREGNELNRAHWMRHALTANRVIVERGRIRIEMVKPPDTGEVLKPVYSALRNHFRLVSLYDTELAHIGARITNIDLAPSTGVPIQDEEQLADWQRIPGFANETALCFQLLRTFMAPPLKDDRRCDPNTLEKLRTASLEDVDLRILTESEGTAEPRTEYEKTFAATSLAENQK